MAKIGIIRLSGSAWREDIPLFAADFAALMKMLPR
jgi:hypothetical protein